MNYHPSTQILFVLSILAGTSVLPAQQDANPPKPPHTSTADHLLLARYFRDLASQEQALAESYERLAEIYQEQSPPPGLDAAKTRELNDQYRRLAEAERKGAVTAAGIAAYHSRLAEVIGRTETVKPVKYDDSAFRR